MLCESVTALSITQSPPPRPLPLSLSHSGYGHLCLPALARSQSLFNMRAASKMLMIISAGEGVAVRAYGLTDTPTIHAYKNNKYWFDVERGRGWGERVVGGVVNAVAFILANAFNHFRAAAWRGYMYAKRLSHKPRTVPSPPTPFFPSFVYTVKTIVELLHI